MYPLPPGDAEAILHQLASSRQFKIKIDFLDKNENYIGSISNAILGGSIQVDGEAEVNRILSLLLFDPRRSIFAGYDYASLFLQIKYTVQVPDASIGGSSFGGGAFSEYSTMAEGGGWRDVDIPVFTGPITGFSRDGAQVAIEAQSKESLLLDPNVLLEPVGIWWDVPIISAIQQVMAHTGETKFALSGISGVTYGARMYMPGDSVWKALRGGSVGEGLDGTAAMPIMADVSPPLFLMYDANGFMTTRPMNTDPVFTFDGSYLLSRPQITYDMLAFRNHGYVSCDNPNGGNPFVGEWSIPASNPRSPESLARNGSNRYLSIVETGGSFVSSAACAVRAQRLVEESDLISIDASFTCLPIPHLEPNDICEVDFRGENFRFRLKSFTLPLTASESMQIGVTTAPLPKDIPMDPGHLPHKPGRLRAVETGGGVFNTIRELMNKRRS